MSPSKGPTYVHGYTESARARLLSQAQCLAPLLHHDTTYPPGAQVLETGCGAGGQTVILATRSAQTSFTSVDLNETSLAQAKRHCAGFDNVRFVRSDVHSLPFETHCFDHAFVCFLLEHLRRPRAALQEILRVLRPGGTLTVIEGDHGSVIMSPPSSAAQAAIDCQVRLQSDAGGDPAIGRRLYPLLSSCGVNNIRVTPRTVYADASVPDIVEGFVLQTFTDMVAGVQDDAVASGLTTPEAFTLGIDGLRRCAETDGTFTYTFFKAVGIRGAAEDP